MGKRFINKFDKRKINMQIQGFKASAIEAGIKINGGLDLALIFSEVPAIGAALFTTNKVKAAPVILSQKHIEKGTIRAIIANSGNANACTGIDGLNKVKQTAKLISKELGIKPDEVIVASTGVIGAPLDIDAIAQAIPRLVKSLSPKGFNRAAEAIKTTDAFSKQSLFEGTADGKSYKIMGIGKGAGMIMPNMATMLSFIVSDININLKTLNKAIKSSARTTFNRISVDGDTSTNDMVVVMANGMAKNNELSMKNEKNFQDGLTKVMDELSTMIVRDGEGATKIVRIKVKNAFSAADALSAVKTVANSILVKTAFYGEDPNWGRIMAAIGRAGIHMKEETIDIWINEIKIVEGGLGLGIEAEKRTAEAMKKKELSIMINLNQGTYEDQMVTCDLTHNFVSMNAEYRT
jgi:glutamate N-acetyltransferase/amino-acid N-acetyltransferase